MSNWRDVSADTPLGLACRMVIVVAARNARQESGMVATDAAAAANANAWPRRREKLCGIWVALWSIVGSAAVRWK